MRLLAVAAASLLASAGVTELVAQQESAAERAARQSRQAEARGLAEPFKGITTDGTPLTGLYPIRSTGVSTAPVVDAARALIASMTPTQQAKTLFAHDDPEWRKWMNQHFYVRQGLGFKEMSDSQREAAFGLLGASLSAKGLKLSRDIMRLNHTLAELTGNFEEYGEWLYWITIMGEPSETEPWGWQLDGHHLIINYFVLGDQVVMTPMFVGSEPVTATSGTYRGVSILQQEQQAGLALVNALMPGQRKTAILDSAKAGFNTLTEAFRDNVVLDYAGVSARSFSPAQRRQLLDLIGLFVGNLREGHARVRMAEVEEHLDRTHFAWIGKTEPDAVFYYRIHSPVILIEFDHQRPIALGHLHGSGPTREHIHAVVRTPNGNDYGKDLLREHHRRHTHPH